MKTHLEFRSKAFPACPGEEDEINPNRFGKRLAEYIAASLPVYHWEVAGISPEDWGWRVDLRHDAFPLWIGCGNYEEHEDGFLCFIEPSKPVVRRWWKRIPTVDAVQRVAEALDPIIRNGQGVRDVRWWTDDEA